MTRRWQVAFGVLILAVGMGLTGVRAVAQSMAERIQKKAAQAQSGVRGWAEEGRDASAVIAIMQQVKPALDAGDPRKAEALLDRALEMLAVAVPRERESDLYVSPEPVAISGYEGSAMEPFISPDSRILFFNNENDPKVDTNLHFAERTGKLSFRYLGELPGVNSPMLDAVPSLDLSGRFYFTTVRDYGRTQNSIYTGMFDGKRVTNVRSVPGDISPKAPLTINMDVGISPDGQTLYISRAVISPGSPMPRTSELMIARKKNDAFSVDADGGRIMAKINTGALQYAPCISEDGLELYFTRAAPPRIMVAARRSADDPFDEPRVLKELTGFVEAPSISLDRQEMFFHKKVGQKFTIYRAERRVN